VFLKSEAPLYTARHNHARCSVVAAGGGREGPPWRQPRDKTIVSLINSHTNVTGFGWHLWEIDLRFAPELPPGRGARTPSTSWRRAGRTSTPLYVRLEKSTIGPPSRKSGRPPPDSCELTATTKPTERGGAPQVLLREELGVLRRLCTPLGS